MFQGPDYTQIVSLRLSEVLADIGMNERTVTKRRNAVLLKESLHTSLIQADDVFRGSSRYYLGSQSEGTTTIGLKSDVDMVGCLSLFNIIEDVNEWEAGVITYLMIEDRSVSPGYCLLQLLRSDVPLPETHLIDAFHFRDSSGRILHRNDVSYTLTAADTDEDAPDNVLRYGPSTVPIIGSLGRDHDWVSALQCKSWPLQARRWLDKQSVGQWPSDELRKYCSKISCFVVPVGRKGSQYEELEWRISTSLAERRLMFSLNMTQIRCYVLMKMLLKTYIKPYYADAISSYMCKTVIFQTIANTHSSFWRESNLIVCLSRCLLVLYNYVLNESCPHFIIPGNNLMAGRIAYESKPQILEILQCIMINKEIAVLGIKCDDLGARLLRKDFCPCKLKMTYSLSAGISITILSSLAGLTNMYLKPISKCSYEVAIQTLLKYIFILNGISNQGRALDQKACTILTPWFYTTLGSVLASLSIQQNNYLSANASGWISMGLNTDVSVGKLKQASIFYCIGDYQRTQTVLRDVEGNYDLNEVEPICNCYYFEKKCLKNRFLEIFDINNENALRYVAAFCVRFLLCEINCVPHELRYEFFRSTKDDLAFRSKLDIWMDDLAVVDSLPYLYFLQYKTYSSLGRQDYKQRALSNLLKTADQEPNFAHRETALNLLGQCMEGENRPNDALNCYVLSISMRERNNAANIHICRLLSKLVNDPARNQTFHYIKASTILYCRRSQSRIDF